MIDVLRLDGKKYWVNPHMIESMETTPDLTLTMLSGKKIIVKKVQRKKDNENKMGSNKGV